MFFSANNFNEDRQAELTGWNVGKGKSLSRMCENSRQSNTDLLGWDVIQDIDFSGMISRAKVFAGSKPKLAGWDVSRDTDFSEMLFGAVSFNQDLPRRDASNGTDFRGLFFGASAFI